MAEEPMNRKAQSAAWISAAVLSAGVWQVLAAPTTPTERTNEMRTGDKPSVPAHPIDELLQAFKKVNKGQVDVREDQDRGFGARRLYVAIYPDCTYWITLLSIDGSVASASISYSGSISSESWSRVVAALKSVGLPVAPAQAQSAGYYLFEDRARLASLSRNIAAELGEPSTVKVPKSLAIAYAALMSPSSRLVFGSACGVAGSKPAGRVGAEALLKAKRVDLLNNILRGPSPEGRVYAVQALEALRAKGVALGEADQVAIAKVKALPILINACAGCMPENKPAAELLADRSVAGPIGRTSTSTAN